MASVVIIGPAHPLRGGLATFNQRLAKQFIDEGHDCSLLSFSLQYPGFLFPGTTQYTDEPAPEGLRIRTLINSVNPLNWIKVGRMLRRERPDLIVVRYWLPFMGPALGTILRIARRNGHTRIVCIADNVVPHEKRPMDESFTKYFLPAIDGFVTMSDKVMADLKRFVPQKPAQLVRHPLYDNFGAHLPKEAARTQLGLPANEKIVLFFGFIRKYKGLDLLLEAMAEPAMRDIRLLVAGEFYEDEAPYQAIINENGLQDRVLLHTRFIPDSEVRYYLCAGDFIIQPYRNATQSGVTPLAYYFERPMVVTNVGGLPDLVPDERCGVVCAPEPAAIAQAITKCYELGEAHFIPHLREEKQKYAWNNITTAIFQLAGN